MKLLATGHKHIAAPPLYVRPKVIYLKSMASNLEIQIMKKTVQIFWSFYISETQNKKCERILHMTHARADLRFSKKELSYGTSMIRCREIRSKC